MSALALVPEETTISEKVEQLFLVRKKIESIKKLELKDLETRKKELEAQIFQSLDDEGIDGTKVNGVGSVSINEAIVPQAEDWDAFYEWVLEDKLRFSLLNRALNAAAFREALNVEGAIPGLSGFNKRTLSVRKA